MSTLLMALFIVKIISSALIIAGVSELAKVYPKWAAFFTALPLVSLLALIWVFIETKDMPKIAEYTKGIVIWTLPSFLFFIPAIFLFRTKLHFVFSFLISLAVFALGIWLVQKWGYLKG